MMRAMKFTSASAMFSPVSLRRRCATRDAAVRLSPVRGEISPNLEPDFGSGSQIFMNPNLNLREPDFGSSSGSSRV